MARFYWVLIIICIAYNGFRLPLGSVAMGLANFLDQQLATQQFTLVNHFENTIDHENLTDNFYKEFKTELGRNFDLVNAHYARKHFVGGKIIKQEEQEEESPACSADGLPRYNFVVAQKSFNDLGTLNDRWDLKVNSFGHQFIGLYHGSDPFITNRMRSYMIRWIGNGIKDYLLVLEETMDKLRDHVEVVQSELRNVIRYIIRRLRAKIEDLWGDLDFLDAHETPGHHEPLAGGSLVVVSWNYIIAINMGKGRIYAWDDSGHVTDLTGGQENRDLSWFIDGKHAVEAPPYIHIQSRDFTRQKFVVLIGAETAELVSQDDLTEILWSQLSNGLESEQQLFVAIANGVLRVVSDKMNGTMAEREDNNSSRLDHSVVIVGLDRLDNNDTNWIDSFKMAKSK